MPGPTRVHPPDGFQRTSQFVGVARYHGPARPQGRGLLSSYSALGRAPLVRRRDERGRLDVLGAPCPRRAVHQRARRRGPPQARPPAFFGGRARRRARRRREPVSYTQHRAHQTRE